MYEIALIFANVEVHEFGNFTKWPGKAPFFGGVGPFVGGTGLQLVQYHLSPMHRGSASNILSPDISVKILSSFLKSQVHFGLEWRAAGPVCMLKQGLQPGSAACLAPLNWLRPAFAPHA